jgi:hypothetical protein
VQSPAQYFQLGRTTQDPHRGMQRDDANPLSYVLFHEQQAASQRNQTFELDARMGLITA